MKFFFLFLIGVVLPLAASAQQLTPLARQPHWASLQRYANTITASKLEQDLQEVYVPDGSWKNWITITPEEAVIQPYPDAPAEQALH